MKAAVIASLWSLALAACGPKPPAPPDKPAPVAELADNCTTGDDCALVDACCGCNAGGRKLAIRKDAVAGFVASYKERCRGQMCAQMISQHPRSESTRLNSSH